MILKVKKADGSGWVARDNIKKVVYNLYDWHFKLKGDDFEVYHQDSEQPMNFTDINMVEFDKGRPSQDGRYPCCFVCMETGHSDYEMLAVFNTQAFLLNDEGKTIERL